MKLSRFCPERIKSKSSTETRRRERHLSSYQEARKFDSRKNDKDQNNGEFGDITNIYECIMMGINWWKFLERIWPKIPTKVMPELMAEIRKIDISELKARFGPTPTKADLPAIEDYLKIDLFTYYGGRFSPLGISYRSRFSKFKSGLDALEQGTGRSGGRPVVILQSARAYFHKIGTFHVIPTRQVATDRDKEWITFWQALVKYRYPKLTKNSSAFCQKIYQMKTELEMPFTIGSGALVRIRKKFQIPIRLFVGKIVNDNVNNKVCFYATPAIRNKEYLNLLVASYLPDEFDREFKKLANISYNELRRNPAACPILAADKKYKLGCLAADRAADADRNAAAAGVFDQNDGDIEDIVDFDAAANDDEEFNYDPYLDVAAAEEQEEIDNALDDQVYRPIRNVASLAPNVFDDNTTVRILGPREVYKMPVCPTKNCLYSHEKPTYMASHVKNCSAEPLVKIRQSVQGADVIDHVYELAEEGYLPSVDYSQDFFATYDIECLMSKGMLLNDNNEDDNERTYHNVATIASLASDGEKRGFTRQDMTKGSVMKMLAEYVNYLITLRDRQPVPDCILKGIEYYSLELSDKERRLKYSFDEIPRLQKKLNYLKDFTKLKVYSWCGERYDLTVLFSPLASCLREFARARGGKVWPIKRGNGYMLLEAIGISFRDFRNYTAPMSLADLAKSCGLDTSVMSKGSFCYEWYTDVEQLRKAFFFPAYTCFYSTMYTGAFHRGRRYCDDMNKIIVEKMKSDTGWTDDAKFLENLATFLCLDSLIDDPVLLARSGDNSGYAAFDRHLQTLDKIFKWSEALQCRQCDPNDIIAQEFFRFSPRAYEESQALWERMADDIDEQNERNGGEEHEQHRMTMMAFLMNYNFNDVRLLKASIEAYATSYRQKFKVGLHGDLSIAKMAQKIAFIQYDRSLPPLYSIPPKAAFFYNDCRRKLLGGICQVFHRLIYLNEKADPRIPQAATTAPNGDRYKRVVSLDFNSLYPYVVAKDLPCGPGILYTFDERTSRFYNEGLYNQKQNPSLESIRYLEYENAKPEYNGRIQHAYNLAEKKIGNHCVDGYFEDVELTVPGTDIPKKTIFEFRGCTFHTCPYCKRKPWLGVKKTVKDAEGKNVKTTITAEELRREDDARMQAIVDTLRAEYEYDNAPYEGFIGPLNFRHNIIIEYNCRWQKEWCVAIYTNKEEPQSEAYPFLYMGALHSPRKSNPGVTMDDFKRVLRSRREDGSSRFFGLAMVDLKSSEAVIKANAFLPPIFDKKVLDSTMLGGHMKRMIPPKVVDKIYPSEENVFCYNTTGYLATSEMLAYYDSKGIDYKVHYFVEYYRGAPFKNFVKQMVRDRVVALSQGNVTMQLVVKLLLNAMVGRFALAVARFTVCAIVGCDKMLNVIRSPMLKSTKPLRSEDDAIDPLYEVVSKKKRIIEDLALQIQIYVYQDGG